MKLILFVVLFLHTQTNNHMNRKHQKKHPIGMPWGDASKNCDTCFWSRLAGPGPKVLRCVVGGNVRVAKLWKSCISYEDPVDCLDCGACCGPAYDAVEISSRDPVRRKHGNLVVKNQGRFQIKRRLGNYCAALLSDNKCVIYSDRPQCCRGFERGSANCLFARQRTKYLSEER